MLKHMYADRQLSPSMNLFIAKVIHRIREQAGAHGSYVALWFISVVVLTTA